VIAACSRDGELFCQQPVGLSEAGQGRYHEIRATLEDVTARLFADFPPEDLATAGHVLSITTRADAELADPEL
jgi:hypothetical protein